MKRFNFSLEKVLELRSFREREAEIELARTIGALSVIENKIMETAKKRVEAASMRFQKGQRVSEIISIDLYIIRLDKLKDQLLEDAAKARLLVEEAREKYIEASREKKVIEKLKEKQFKEYKKLQKNEEIKMIDDISNGKSLRIALVEGVQHGY